LFGFAFVPRWQRIARAGHDCRENQRTNERGGKQVLVAFVFHGCGFQNLMSKLMLNDWPWNLPADEYSLKYRKFSAAFHGI